MSRFHCPVCNLISPGDVCGNPGCSSWEDELERDLDVGETWLDRLKILDSVTVQFRARAAAPPYLNVSMHGCTVFDPAGRNWLYLAGWKNGATPRWVPGIVWFSRRRQPHGIRVESRGAGDVRVHFQIPDGFRNYDASPIYRTDLRYHEIGSILCDLGQPAVVASEILLRVQGGVNLNFGIYDQFIDGMIVLVFGVESARNWATLATSLMLLELVAAGRTFGSGDLFTLENAFHDPSGKKWHDDTTLFGGTFPMATHGTGPGNMVERGEIIRDQRSPYSVPDDPQHHAVIFREVGLIRHWLSLTDGIPIFQGRDLRQRIEILLHNYYG